MEVVFANSPRKEVRLPLPPVSPPILLSEVPCTVVWVLLQVWDVRLLPPWVRLRAPCILLDSLSHLVDVSKLLLFGLGIVDLLWLLLVRIPPPRLASPLLVPRTRCLRPLDPLLRALSVVLMVPTPLPVVVAPRWTRPTRVRSLETPFPRGVTLDNPPSSPVLLCPRVSLCLVRLSLVRTSSRRLASSLSRASTFLPPWSSLLSVDPASLSRSPTWWCSWLTPRLRLPILLRRLVMSPRQVVLRTLRRRRSPRRRQVRRNSLTLLLVVWAVLRVLLSPPWDRTMVPLNTVVLRLNAAPRVVSLPFLGETWPRQH